MFTVIRAVLLKLLQYRDHNRLDQRHRHGNGALFVET